MVQSADDGSDGSGPRIITHVDDSRTLATGKLTMSGATAGVSESSECRFIPALAASKTKT